MTIKENITGLQHLGIPAVDLGESIKWYTELPCGFREKGKSRH